MSGGRDVNASAPKAKSPEQLGLSLPAHDRASWRRLARVRHLGCLNSMILFLARLWHSLLKLMFTRLAGPVRWAQSAVNAS
jgi:hypothetical protein